ncbi:GntR family transcriptional regulator [Paractinoplanes durhamensis]|uniref:GntR family transcriptional regulator n=1 Tax=Paractinoplanes durhamensis TaxID=113563 RepID=UPI003629AC13
MDAPYRQIAQDIRSRIESGELRPGDRVPSARALVRTWGSRSPPPPRRTRRCRRRG